MIATNTFAFIKYIFIKELESDSKFELKSFVNKGFFVQVFLALVDKQICDGSYSGKSRLRDSIALYECTKIEAAYFDNIRKHFSNRLNMFLTIFVGKNKDTVKLRLREEIFIPCNKVKLTFSKQEVLDVGILDVKSKAVLKALLLMYGDD
ncbi:hypothetical protein INT47_010830 [Mucor saturninus]|uniref:Uncharacterized protein n=1 Tax=Mucor saturninus TaxID=64648 RepID=A0A8H7QYM5_9FUNG|nr:hypothetical protein INT47_010830 [Mucor saturninus]